MNELTIRGKVREKAMTVGNVVHALTKPANPSEGPPLPSSWSVYWPGFFKRGITRIIESPPWKTIPEKGLRAELKEEFEVVTGFKI